MSKAKMNVIQARLDVMAVALTAMTRAVPAEPAAAVQDGLRRAVAQRLDGVALSPDADAAVAADLGGLMNALVTGPPGSRIGPHSRDDSTGIWV